MKKAVVLLSGGLDSTTTLAIAKDRGFTCYALTIDYAQRLLEELNAASRVAKALGVARHRIVSLEIGAWGGSALTDSRLAVPNVSAARLPAQEIPITYVPARNTIFLSTALAWAEALSAYDIFFGANVVDYSNYPDCRPEYIAAFEKMANLGTRASLGGQQFKIHAPLLHLSKAEIIQRGRKLGVDYQLTFSCYDPTFDGQPCEQCDACRIRTAGFQLADQSRKNKKMDIIDV